MFDGMMDDMPAGKPAASPVAGVSQQRDYHFSDEQVMEALVGTDYLREHVRLMLVGRTSGEKWSLYRAIVKLAQPSAEGDGWIAVTPETMPQVGLIVDVYQLYGWAKWTGTEWIAVDRCGNESCLMWTPKYWVYRPLPAPPSGQGKKV